MYDKMVRFIKQTGKAHKWLKPLALILLFCSAALARLAANWPVQKTTSIPRGGKYKGIYHLARGSSKHQTKRRNRPNPSALRPSRRPAARAAAAALSVCMVFTLMPSMAFAVEAEPLPPEDATVTAFDELDEAVRYPSVTTGTPLEELVLPDTLSATAQAGVEEPMPVKISGVVWEPD